MLKSLNISVLILILLQGSGIVLYNSVNQLCWRVRVDEDFSELEKENDVFFEFSKKEYASYRIDRKEFIYKGNMYDIKHLSIEDEWVCIAAKCDLKDTKYKNTIASLMRRNEQEYNLVVIKLISLVYLVPVSIQLPFPTSIPSKSAAYYFKNFYAFLSQSEHFHPPKCIFMFYKNQD